MVVRDVTRDDITAIIDVDLSNGTSKQRLNK